MTASYGKLFSDCCRGGGGRILNSTRRNLDWAGPGLNVLQGIVADVHFGAGSEPFWQRIFRVIRNSTELNAALLFLRFSFITFSSLLFLFKLVFCSFFLFANFAHFVGVSWSAFLSSCSFSLRHS